MGFSCKTTATVMCDITVLIMSLLAWNFPRWQPNIQNSFNFTTGLEWQEVKGNLNTQVVAYFCGKEWPIMLSDFFNESIPGMAWTCNWCVAWPLALASNELKCEGPDHPGVLRMSIQLARSRNLSGLQKVSIYPVCGTIITLDVVRMWLLKSVMYCSRIPFLRNRILVPYQLSSFYPYFRMLFCFVEIGFFHAGCLSYKLLLNYLPNRISAGHSMVKDIGVILWFYQGILFHSAESSINSAICDEISKLCLRFYNVGLWENIWKRK